jgi:hypothetical protein
MSRLPLSEPDEPPEEYHHPFADGSSGGRHTVREWTRPAEIIEATLAATTVAYDRPGGRREAPVVRPVARPRGARRSPCV